MNHQTERHAEIRRISDRLTKTKGPAAARLAERLDQLIEEAAQVETLKCPQQADAALRIVLHSMGCDHKKPTSEERMILAVSRYLQTLLCCIIVGQEFLAPCIGGCGTIISKMTGLT